MFTRIKNFFLCRKYPFLKVYNDVTGKFCGYTVIQLDYMEPGWRKAFGQQLCDDLKDALIKDKYLKEFRFTQIKEKYGQLCLYNNFGGENTSKVISYYEAISIAYCQECGNPAKFCTRGWLSFLCPNCMKNYVDDRYKHIKDRTNALMEARLTEADIPVYKHSDPDMQAMYDAINWYDLWGIEKKKKETEE